MNHRPSFLLTLWLLVHPKPNQTLLHPFIRRLITPRPRRRRKRAGIPGPIQDLIIRQIPPPPHPYHPRPCVPPSRLWFPRNGDDPPPDLFELPMHALHAIQAPRLTVRLDARQLVDDLSEGKSEILRQPDEVVDREMPTLRTESKAARPFGSPCRVNHLALCPCPRWKGRQALEMLQEMRLPWIDGRSPGIMIIIPRLRQPLQDGPQDAHPPPGATFRHILYGIRVYVRAEDVHPVAVEPYQVCDDRLAERGRALAEQVEGRVVWWAQERAAECYVDVDEGLKVVWVREGAHVGGWQWREQGKQGSDGAHLRHPTK